jgi:hypothetical protein
MLNNENKNRTLTNKLGLKETELIDMNRNDIKNINSGYSKIQENEISTSSKLLEINEDNDNNDKDNNISGIITNSMYYDGEIKYRTGNLYTFFYDEKGIPKIVIGPDCK